jgi:putative glutamine amidotransferase
VNPLIGITGSRHQFESRVPAMNMLGVVSGDDYARAVEACGGIPMVIPYITRRDTISNLAQKLDGLVLGGGEDPDPALYGQNPQHGLGTVDLERDELELGLVGEMLTAGKPIFGICRGIQLLNVAFGGTLWQDLRNHWHGTIQHQQRAGRKHLSHVLQIAQGSQLQTHLGGVNRLRCNSFHHQAVHHVGMDLRPVAWDEEGLVEAIEHPDFPFVIGVQWHPENIWNINSQAKRLFEAFVSAARSVSL